VVLSTMDSPLRNAIRLLRGEVWKSHAPKITFIASVNHHEFHIISKHLMLKGNRDQKQSPDVSGGLMNSTHGSYCKGSKELGED